MNKGRILRIILIPALVGLIMTTAAYVFLARVRPSPESQLRMVEVVVAKAAVQAKTALTKDMVTSRQIPAKYMGPNEITSPDEVIGKITTVPLAEGESILKTKLASKENKSGLAYYIPEGRRAMTIKVNEVIGAAAFPEPGDHVDILGTFSKDTVGVDKTRVVAENLLILAAAREIESKSGEKKDMKSFSSMTLAVRPEEALKITLAEEKGSLRLLLRPALPENSVGEIEQLITGFGSAPAPAPAPAPKR